MLVLLVKLPPPPSSPGHYQTSSGGTHQPLTGTPRTKLNPIVLQNVRAVGLCAHSTHTLHGLTTWANLLE